MVSCDEEYEKSNKVCKECAKKDMIISNLEKDVEIEKLIFSTNIL